MQRLILSGLAVVAAALPFATQADTMDYSWAEFGYVETELDAGGFDVDGDGFALRGSVAFLENFFAFAGYEDIGFDGGVDLSQIQVGVGGHWPINERMDIVGRLGIVKLEVEAGPFDDDEDGFLVGARLRGVVAPKFELEGGFDYVDVGDDDDTALVGEGRYFFTEMFAGGLLISIADDVTTLGLNLRVTF
jgi:hypothetical protein